MFRSSARTSNTSHACIYSMICGVAAACFTGALASAAAGETEAAKPDNGPTLDNLLQRIDSLERRNKSLEGQVGELKALEGEKWLSQERADQIRSVVADVIADADSRASLRQDAMTAGWNDGFFLASPDGRFKLQVNGLIQPRFMWNHMDGNQAASAPYTVPDLIENRYGFDSQFNELTFKGHIFSPAIEFMVKTNVSMNNNLALGTTSDNLGNVTNGPESGQLYLLDAWARIGFSDEWSLRFGQYRSPYAREQLITEQNQMAVSRSGIVRNFGLWYTQGIEFQYQGDDFRWNLSVDDGGSSNVDGTTLNLVGGRPLNAPWYTQQVSYSVTSRLEWKPYGAWKDFTSLTSPVGEQQGMLVGFSYHTQATSPNQLTNTSTIGASENYWDAWTLDSQWNFGGASIFVSGFYNYINAQSAYANTINGTTNTTPLLDVGYVNAYGVVLQPAIYILPKWELYARYEYGYIQFNNSDSLRGIGGAIADVAQQTPFQVITAGVNWYIDGQDLKWTTDVGFGLNSVGYSWQNLPAGWRISGDNQIVVRSQLQLMF